MSYTFRGYVQEDQRCVEKYTILICPVQDVCLDHLFLLDLIILVRFCKQFKLWSFPLCSFLQPHVTFSKLHEVRENCIIRRFMICVYRTKYFLQHHNPKYPQSILFPQCVRPSFTLIFRQLSLSEHNSRHDN